MKKISKKTKKLLLSAFVLLAVFLVSFAVISASSGLSSFGGQISAIMSCTCSEGSQVTITNSGHNARFSGTYLYLPSVTQVKKGQVAPSRTVLGQYSSGGTCMVGTQPYCTSLPISKGTMKTIGVSFR